MEFSFKAFGQNHVGGKGLAFWYTKERAVDGLVFGNQEKYEGLGVFMDSSDPLNQVRRLAPLTREGLFLRAFDLSRRAH